MLLVRILPLRSIPIQRKTLNNKDKGIIKFGDGGEGGKQRGYVLLEELIHVYQREQVPDQVYEAAKLNYEIEAKVGWLMYEKRKLSTELEFDQYDLELGSTFLFDILIIIMRMPDIRYFMIW